MNDCLQCDESSDLVASCGPRRPRAGDASVARLLPGTVFADRYLIGGELGQGGMGVIYDARHLGTNQPVAIKTLHANMLDDRSVIARFCREGRITASLEHPNTVRAFDFGNADGVFYLAMERLRGRTLAQRLQQLVARRACLPPREVIRLAIAVLRSLDEAHRAGIVHRDLKPANIFLHALGVGTLVKVIDFGIARDRTSHLTVSGQVLGTPGYISPEQVLDGIVDSRADLYSLGIVMYECLTGRLPYAGNVFGVLLQQVQGEVPDPERDGGVHGGVMVPQALAAIVRRALAKKPADRFQTADEMRRALEELRNKHWDSASVVVVAEGGLNVSVQAPTVRQPRVANALIC